MKKALIVLFFLGFAELSIAQDYKFGKVSEEELSETVYALDSSANAAILYKKRSSFFTYLDGGINLTTDYHFRIKIYNKEGIDWATHKEFLSKSGGDREQFSSLKAVTYNLIDGKIDETKLDKKEVFKERVHDNLSSVKFTMPNVKDGAVIEYKYRVTSPFFWKIDDVVAQYGIPIKKLDVSIALWEYFKFSTMAKGYYLLDVKTSQKFNRDFDTNDVLKTINQDHIPAVKEEAYVNNINNYRAGIAFEISQFIIPGRVYENYATSWDDVVKNIYKSENFGGQLGKLRFLSDDLEAIKLAATTDEQKIAAALAYVKSKIAWNGFNGKYSSSGLKKAVEEGSGNSADVNLLLIGVLQELGLNANPLLVSTRSNGVVLFPSEEGFNYVVAAIEGENSVLVIDATEKYSVPGILPERVLNWKGRIVRENGSSTWVELKNSQPSKVDTNLSITINDDGTLKGMSRTRYVNYAAMEYRDKNNKVVEDDLIASLEIKNGDIMIDEFKIQNKKEFYKPVIELFTFEGEDMIEEIGNQMMFQPLFFKALTENPFKIDERSYPIDFGSPFEFKNSIRITVPNGYEIVSVPETMAIGLPNQMGVYKFVINQQGNSIMVMTVFKMNTPIYPANEYKPLKEFYSAMVNKSLENVVIKKIESLN